jgi:predicted nucleic acid-binding protein
VATNPLLQIGWDSVAVIDFLDQKAGRFPFLLPIAKDAEDRKLIIVISTMAVAETLHLSTAPPADQARIISDFFDRPFVHREAAGLSVCEIARDIRRAHPVDGADSIHLATAVHTNTPFFLTNDGDSKRKKKPLLPLDKKIVLANESSLRIMTPESYDKMRAAVALPLMHMTQPQPSSPKQDE